MFESCIAEQHGKALRFYRLVFIGLSQIIPASKIPCFIDKVSRKS